MVLESRLGQSWAVAVKMCLPVLLQLVSSACSGWKSPWRKASVYSARQAGASCLKIVIAGVALVRSCFFSA